MKAFGVRLAAGAATILVGFFMATQSQKNLQTEADSAWTSDSIPPAKPVEPVGGGRLVSSEPMPGELKPFDNPFANSDTEQEAAIALVGHTDGGESPEAPATMLLPTTGEPVGDVAPASTMPASTMKLVMPGGADAPTEPANTTSPTLKMSAPTFVGSLPTTEEADPAPENPNAVAGFPSNGLRGAGTSLRGETTNALPAATNPNIAPSGQAASDSTISAVTQLLMQVPPGDEAPQSSPLAATPEATSTPEAITPTMQLRPVQAAPGSDLIAPQFAVFPGFARRNDRTAGANSRAAHSNAVPRQ